MGGGLVERSQWIVWPTALAAPQYLAPHLLGTPVLTLASPTVCQPQDCVASPKLVQLPSLPRGGSPSTLQLRTLTMVKLLLLLIALCAVAHGRTMLEQGERARVSWYGRMPGVGSRFALQAAPPAL